MHCGVYRIGRSKIRDKNITGSKDDNWEIYCSENRENGKKAVFEEIITKNLPEPKKISIFRSNECHHSYAQQDCF